MVWPAAFLGGGVFAWFFFLGGGRLFVCLFCFCFCFVLFCFVLFCFVLFCFVLFVCLFVCLFLFFFLGGGGGGPIYPRICFSHWSATTPPTNFTNILWVRSTSETDLIRPNKKIPLFPVSRPSLIFTPDPNTFYCIWVDQRKRERKTSRRSVFLQEFVQCLHNKELN